MSNPTFSEKFPDASLEVQAAYIDLMNNPGSERFAAVPLVYQSVRQVTIGTNPVKEAVFACINPETGVIKLDSVSEEGKSTEEVAQVAYDLVEPLMTEAMAMDIVGVITKAMEGGYRSAGGVLMAGNPAQGLEFGLLVVPKVFMFGVYDDLVKDGVPPAIGNQSREEASTGITANIFNWVVQRSLGL